jgi:hypothetical protein
MNAKIYDNSKAEKALETIASQGTGLSARCAKVILAYAREAWEGNIRAALADIGDGTCSRTALYAGGAPLADVIRFAEKIPTGFGYRPMTAEELASEETARLNRHRVDVLYSEQAPEGVAVFSVRYGEVTGLPQSKAETCFVVSMMVKAACPNRTDLLSPGELVRGDDGQPIGCIGLDR